MKHSTHSSMFDLKFGFYTRILPKDHFPSLESSVQVKKWENPFFLPSGLLEFSLCTLLLRSTSSSPLPHPPLRRLRRLVDDSDSTNLEIKYNFSAIGGDGTASPLCQSDNFHWTFMGKIKNVIVFEEGDTFSFDKHMFFHFSNLHKKITYNFCTICGDGTASPFWRSEDYHWRFIAKVQTRHRFWRGRNINFHGKTCVFHTFSNLHKESTYTFSAIGGRQPLLTVRQFSLEVHRKSLRTKSFSKRTRHFHCKHMSFTYSNSHNIIYIRKLHIFPTIGGDGTASRFWRSVQRFSSGVYRTSPNMQSVLTRTSNFLLDNACFSFDTCPALVSEMQRMLKIQGLACPAVDFKHKLRYPLSLHGGDSSK